jgi:hypothetical protein
MQQQTQENPPQEEQAKGSISRWQRYRNSRRARRWTYAIMVLIPVVLMIISMMTVFTRPRFNPNEGRTIKTPQAVPGNKTAPRPTDPNVLTQQVLTDLNAHGYDDRYQTILINWRKSNTGQVNCSPERCDTRTQLSRVDKANDLRDLENLYWYKALHPGDTTMDNYIARMLPIVKAEWGDTTLNKGWVYYTLLRIRAYSHDSAYWDKTIQHWVASQYSKIDSQKGVQHGKIDTTAGGGNVTLADGYRVDHALETGLALVDAGIRYHQPAWIATGKKAVSVVIKDSYNKQFHLFGRIYLVQDPRYGTDELLDTQARMGETGQELEALLRTGAYTRNSEYLRLAREIIDGLQNSPLRDRQNGGFFFKIFLGPYMGQTTGYVDKSIKEARQLHTLIAIHLANQIFNNRWAELEQDVTRNAVQHLFLPAPVPGFTYRIRSDGDLYPCPKCVQPKVEDWVTSEADNIALEAFQTILTKQWLF